MASEARPLELLKWYVEAGADEAIGEVPVDRFAQSQFPESQVPDSRAPERRSAPPPIETKAAPAQARAAAPAAVQGDAHEAAAACQTLDELVAAIEAFDGCALKETASNTVVHDGNPKARVMVVGEAPGGEEDRTGLPFVGPAGRLLDRMLAAIGLDRHGAEGDAAYITNILFWRPPGNRAPTADEIAACIPFTRRQIELVAPAILVPVGGIAAKALLERSEGITRLRGTWREYNSPGLAAPVATMATFHPAYLLRQPLQKRDAWHDLLAIKARLAIVD